MVAGSAAEVGAPIMADTANAARVAARSEILRELVARISTPLFFCPQQTLLLYPLSLNRWTRAAMTPVGRLDLGRLSTNCSHCCNAGQARHRFSAYSSSSGMPCSLSKISHSPMYRAPGRRGIAASADDRTRKAAAGLFRGVSWSYCGRKPQKPLLIRV
jgi:hypothetical protein